MDDRRPPGSHLRPFVLDEGGHELPRGSANVGEFAVEVDTIFSGYWNDTEATAAAFHKGRYLTGDVGYVDHAGYAYIVDRKRDMILSGGAAPIRQRWSGSCASSTESPTSLSSASRTGTGASPSQRLSYARTDRQ